jgi:DsbC/DsbD-like thiol-disulfide interchange protein
VTTPDSSSNVSRLLCGFLASAVAAWLTPLLPAQTDAPVVEARMVLATDAVHPGSPAQAAVVAQIASGYHINDHKPSLDYLIPTELKLEPDKPVEVTKIDYPKGELVKLAFSDSPLSVYQGKIVVGTTLRTAPATAPGSYTVKGKFAYQACNDHACLPPKSVPVTLSVKVVGREVPLKAVNTDVFSAHVSN